MKPEILKFSPNIASEFKTVCPICSSTNVFHYIDYTKCSNCNYVKDDYQHFIPPVDTPHQKTDIGGFAIVCPACGKTDVTIESWSPYYELCECKYEIQCKCGYTYCSEHKTGKAFSLFIDIHKILNELRHFQKAIVYEFDGSRVRNKVSKIS